MGGCALRCQTLTNAIKHETALDGLTIFAHPASQALQSLSLAAPFPVLECFLPDLDRFTGLRQLELRAEMTSADDEEKEVLGWDVKAVLRLPLLAHLPPQLGSLGLSNFYNVELVDVGAASGEAGAAREGAAGSTRPAQLLAGLTRLSISRSRAVLLIMPLPSLRALTIQECSIASLAHKWLRLPQLTSLRLDDGARVRCAAMPELARLSCRCHLDAVDSFSALRQLSHLELNLRDRQRGSQLVTCVAPSLRSLSMQLPPHDEAFARQACHALAAAGASQLTRLVGGRGGCNAGASLPAEALLLRLLALPGMLTCRMNRQPTVAKHAPCLRPQLPCLSPAHQLCALLFLRPPHRRSTAWPACPTCPPGRTCKSCCCAMCSQPALQRSMSPCWWRHPACGAWRSRSWALRQTMQSGIVLTSSNVWRCDGKEAASCVQAGGGGCFLCPRRGWRLVFAARPGSHAHWQPALLRRPAICARLKCSCSRVHPAAGAAAGAAQLRRRALLNSAPGQAAGLRQQAALPPSRQVAGLRPRAALLPSSRVGHSGWTIT